MVNGIDPCLLIPGRLRLAGIGDKGLDICGVHPAHADGRGQFAIGDHRPQVCPSLIYDVGWVLLVVLLDMLLVVQYPGDLAQVHAILRRQDATGPDAGGHGVGPHADFLALQIFGRCYPRLDVIDDGGMVELA
jgi:hypothetical protein